MGCHLLLQGSSQTRDRTRVSCIPRKLLPKEPICQLPSIPPPWVGRNAELYPVVRNAAGSKYSWSLRSAAEETVLVLLSFAWPFSKVYQAFVFSVLPTLRNKQQPVWEGLWKPLPWVREMEYCDSPQQLSPEKFFPFFQSPSISPHWDLEGSWVTKRLQSTSFQVLYRRESASF